MAIHSRTKRQIRQDMIVAALGNDYGCIIGETPSSSSTSTAVYSQLAGTFPNGHFEGGWVRYTNSSTVTRKITAFAGSTCTFTWVAGTVAPVTTANDTTTEILRSGWTFDQFDKAIDQAIRTIGKGALHSATDTSIMIEERRHEYPTPSAWARIHTVEADHAPAPPNGYYLPNAYSRTRTEYAIGSATASTRRAQSFQVSEASRIQTVWVKLRAIGTIADNLTLTIQTDSSSAPSGTNVTNASATYTGSNVPTGDRWIPFEFTSPAQLAVDTTYHIVLQRSGSNDSSNYVAWVGDTASGYGQGTGEVYDSSGGGTWSNVSADYTFRLQDHRTDWRILDDYSRRIVRSTTRNIRISAYQDEGTPIRLQGLKYQSALSAETTTVDIDPEIVKNMALAILFENAAGGDRNMLQQAAYWRKLAEDYLMRNRSVPKGLIIEDN